MRNLIATFKVISFLTLCLLALPIAILWTLLFKNSHHFYIAPRFFHFLTCKIFNLKVITKGSPAKENVFFVGNHISYADIPVLGSLLPAYFVAKNEVKTWPLLGLLANITGTVFIGRRKSDYNDAQNILLDRFRKKQNLVFFAEGTSTDGKDVTPFKSSAFEIFFTNDLKDYFIQPFTLQIHKMNNQTKFEEHRDHYAWYGDMDFSPHLWNLAKLSSVTLKITFHLPLSVQDYKTRKDLVKSAYDLVKSSFLETSP